MNLRKVSLATIALRAAILVACTALLQSAAQAQSLTPWTNPPSGIAGTNNSYATGSGFPSGTITGATVYFGTSCSASSLVTSTAAIQVAVVGSLRRFEFLIPSTLSTATYYVWVSGSAGGTPFNTINTPSCSQIDVTFTSPFASCVPTSSLGVVAGSNVNAYVPFGYWDGSNTGIEEVPLEGTGTAANFPTTGVVNSCAGNSVTGEVVCTENLTNVDLITGSTLTTLTSGADQYTGFSGGSCYNCGVGINSVSNTAVIGIGYSGGASGSGVQVLNLSNNTFNTPFGLSDHVSEDISIDSGRNLILSPGEGGIYDLLQIGAGNALTEYGYDIGGALDSAAEDCSTGIALSSYEFSDDIFITDLTQATFTAGSPGSWSAPGQFIDLEDGGYSAGTCGISAAPLSAAPGAGHYAVVTGEFGGSSYSALLLPSTSGSGTPTLADYAYVSSMPNTPDGEGFSAGYDPHTVTAYTSPTTGLSYAVFADFLFGYPDYLGVVDLACVLAQPRTAGTHNVIGNASSCTRYVVVDPPPGGGLRKQLRPPKQRF